MANSTDTGIHVALDVGSSKVCAVISRGRREGLDILGYGLAANSGVSQGVVEDAAATAQVIREVVAQAARSAELRVTALYASVPQSSTLGSIASVARSIAAREALLICIERAGLRVIDLVPSALASGVAGLVSDERAAGAALLDVGAGVTDIAIYEAGAVVKSDTLDFGAAELTAEIASHFRISNAEAEFLKRNVGCAKPEYLRSDDLVSVPNCSNGTGTAISRRHLARVIEARLAGLWVAARRCLRGAPLQGGIAVSGGGALLDGFPELAEAQLGFPVRRASPCGRGGLPGELQSPSFATAVGIVRYLAQHADVLAQRRSGLRRHTLASA